MNTLTNNQLMQYIQAKIDSGEIKGDAEFRWDGVIMSDCNSDDEPTVEVFADESDLSAVYDALKDDDDITMTPTTIYFYSTGQVAEYIANINTIDD